MKTIALAAAAAVCLMLTACDGGSPSKKPVNVKPADASNQVTSPSTKFQNPGSTEKPGTGGGAPPTTENK